MKLKLDENLGRTVPARLQSGGYDTARIPAHGLSRATDRQVIAACKAEQRCLVTLDLT